MPAKVNNRQNLIENGANREIQHARATLLRAYEQTLAAADPERLILEQLHLEGQLLRVQNQIFALDRFRKISLVGAGKAGAAMVSALEKVLGSRISNGYVNVTSPDPAWSGKLAPNASQVCLSPGGIILNQAGHPVPDAAGLAGAQAIVDIAGQAGEDELLICLLSGGGSSLLPLPRHPVSLADKQQVTGQLLRCGASISEINRVRKHISAIKGGWLAKKAWPATVLNLILSDVPGDPLESIASGPTVADPTTFADAVAVLQRFALYTSVPQTVIQLLEDGIAGRVAETPAADDPVFAKVYNRIIGNNLIARQAMAGALGAAGFNVEQAGSVCTGSIESVVRDLACQIRSLAVRRPAEGPFAVVAGGEVNLRVSGSGKGGRNQEMALMMASYLDGCENVLFAALSTDGIDGPTDAAGALFDAGTLRRARADGLCPDDYLRRHDAWHFFSALGDLVCTGYTGTNVNDLFVCLII